MKKVLLPQGLISTIVAYCLDIIIAILSIFKLVSVASRPVWELPGCNPRQILLDVLYVRSEIWKIPDVTSQSQQLYAC